MYEVMVINMALFGIDLSRHNGDVNFVAVKNAGVRFAMVKASQGHSLSASYSMFEDSKFKQNIEGLTKVGIPVGAYHFLTAATMRECWAEAEFFIKTVEPYRQKITLYLACDAENYGNKYLLSLNRAELTTIIGEFCRVVEKAGFLPCHYTNTDHIRSFIDLPRLDYPVWQAHYASSNARADSVRVTSRPTDAGNKLAIHQYTSNGTLNGVPGVFDLNFGYAPVAVLILRDRCGLEDQTFRYISEYEGTGSSNGEDILMRLADKVVARGLKPLRDPCTPKLAVLLRSWCGLDAAQSAHLTAYKYADDLYYKLYSAMIK